LFEQGLAFMMIDTLLQSIRHNNRQWLTLAVIALSTLASSQIATAKPMNLLANNSSQLSVTPTANGVYLYGESDQPDVVGKEYMVFETIGNKTIGAFYLPSSEFSCFYGQFKGARLDVTLIDSFDLTQYKFALALHANTLTASKQPMMGEPIYQPLTKISANDRQILATCKVQLQK
jgi:hypothetical protein